LQAIEAHAPDIVVADLRMPAPNGLELLAELRSRQIDIRVVILTAEISEGELLEAVLHNVNGVVLKEMAPRLLLQCLRKVHAGGQWLENRAMQNALGNVLRREAGRREAEQELTSREIVLVCMVAEGLRNREIAKRLNISEGTVKTHLRNIYRKLHRETRVALRRYAEERGLI
jgi:DNA-binding NarL/FixJ family response regulator